MASIPICNLDQMDNQDNGQQNWQYPVKQRAAAVHHAAIMAVI